MQQSSIKIGISACLAGEKVRFDSGHKKSNFCMDELGAVDLCSTYINQPTLVATS